MYCNYSIDIVFPPSYNAEDDDTDYSAISNGFISGLVLVLVIFISSFVICYCKRTLCFREDFDMDDVLPMCLVSAKNQRKKNKKGLGFSAAYFKDQKERKAVSSPIHASAPTNPNRNPRPSKALSPTSLTLVTPQNYSPVAKPWQQQQQQSDFFSVNTL